jgi:hypothetical protein
VSSRGHNLDICGKLVKIVRRGEIPGSKSWSALVLFDVATGLKKVLAMVTFGTIVVMVIKFTMVVFVTSMTHVFLCGAYGGG